MLNLRMLSPEAHQAEEPLVSLCADEFDFLKNAITKSSRNRSRICTHKNTDEALHEMFVIYGNETYVRPNKHFDKDESVLVVEGRCDVCFFDNNGRVLRKISLGDQSSGLPYYCRIPKEIYHTVVIHSQKLVLFEATSGPFDPADTHYAEWSPEEGDKEGIKKFQSSLAKFKAEDHSSINLESKYKRLNDFVYLETDKISYLSKAQHAFLANKMTEKHLDRVRICNHLNPRERLHEMLMLFSKDTFVTPSLHIDKEESLFILDGEGRYVFFDNMGKVTDVIHLSLDKLKGKNYCRVPANTHHMLIVDSPTMLVKETTSGPFEKEATIFPEWAPDPNCIQSQKKFLANIEERISG
ncbi:WbuC family cupin fold metalloprotein [Alphaproteobacteria bacterium LSUCC0226]